MKATVENARKLISVLPLPDAIDKDKWQITANNGTVRAENVYHIVDRAGLYDARRKFALVWSEGDMMAFSIEFEVPKSDEGIDGVRSFMEDVIIDKMLDQFFWE